MNKSGPIIIIEDDTDDQELLERIFKKLEYKNKIIFFQDGSEAIKYLNQPDIHPFIIISDINIPKLNGFELRTEILTNEQLQSKCVPYIFFTAASDEKSVLRAYPLSDQGFFTKPSNLNDMQQTIRKIVEYWQECMSPGELR